MVQEQKIKQEMNKEDKGNTDFCKDSRCPNHGDISVRGRSFKGYVKKIVGSRAVVEWERILYVPKYERYEKRRSKMHSHIPSCILNKVKQGSYVLIGECRPLSKITHSIILEVLK